jgi:hypothetical protein
MPARFSREITAFDRDNVVTRKQEISPRTERPSLHFVAQPR